MNLNVTICSKRKSVRKTSSPVIVFWLKQASHQCFPENGSQYFANFRANNLYVLRRDAARRIYETQRMAKHPQSLFGLRLRTAREHAGMAQDKLGVLIGLDEGCSSARISRYETGIHEAPFKVAKSLAAALDVPVAYFYCPEDALAELLLLWHRLPKAEKTAETLAISLGSGLNGQPVARPARKMKSSCSSAADRR
jgi:transcriptional regulator with XRE-family HTH domain